MSPSRRIRAGLALWAVVAAVIAPSTVYAQSDIPMQVIERVNTLRASYGVPAYRIDPILMQVAQAQVDWSAANNHIGHDGPGGSRPNDRALAAGYGGGKRAYATENAAHGSGTMDPEWVMDGWQSDSIHLDAMISADYEDVGVGYAEANGYFWCVLMVGWVDASGSAVATRQPGQNTPSGTSQMPSAGMVRSTALPDGSILHVVQPGETAWSIAALYGLSQTELLTLNHLTETSILHPGDTLMIQPAPAVPTAEQTVPSPENRPTTTPTREAPAVQQTAAPPRSSAELSPFRLLLWALLAVGISMVVIAMVSVRVRGQRDAK